MTRNTFVLKIQRELCHPKSFGSSEKRTPGACFSKVPKLFGRISGDIILFVSSKRRRLEARNLAVILIFIPFTTYEKTSFTEKAGRSFTNGFSGPKSSRDFRETGPWPEKLFYACRVCIYDQKLQWFQSEDNEVPAKETDWSAFEQEPPIQYFRF